MNRWIELEKLNRLGVNDLEMFQQVLEILLTNNCLIKTLERDAPFYRFALKYASLLDAYLGYAGLFLRMDETLGVIGLGGTAGMQASLNLEESLSLLILRLFYEEKIREVSLAQESSIRLQDFLDRYQALSGRLIPKTRLEAVMRRFRRLKLTQLKGEETDPDSILILYPSLVFALDGESINSVHERITLLRAGNDLEQTTETEVENAAT